MKETVKKVISLFLILLAIIGFATTPLSGYPTAKAENEAAMTEETAEKKVSTDIFLPTSYLQYYKLNKPYAICRYKNGNSEFVAISHAGEIVVYDNDKDTGNETFKKIPLEGYNEDDEGVPSLARFGKYLLFTQKSYIYYVDISDFNNIGESVRTVCSCSNSFSVCGNLLAVTTSTQVTYYELTETETGLGFAEREDLAINKGDLKSVMLSKNGKTYFAANSAKADDKCVITEYDQTENTTRTIVSGLSDVRSIAESEDASDNNVYFTTDTGVYSVNPNYNGNDIVTICKISIPDGETKDLGKLWNPRGICLTETGLWIVDIDINAVQEIELKTRTFTKFAITTNSSAVNRLTANASKIVMDNDKIYALDGTRIVIINDINSENRTYNRINLVDDNINIGSVENFAVGNGYILLVRGSDVSLLKIDYSDENNPILPCELKKVTINNQTGMLPNSIDDVCYMDGKFYVLSFTSYTDGKIRPVIYTLDVTKEEFSLDELHTTGNESRAGEITCDVFGALYWSVYENGKYIFYQYANGVETALPYTITEEKDSLLNLQTDLDGNLYALFKNNVIYREDVKMTIETSSNLGDIEPAKSMCLSCDSDKAFFIFNGFILNSSNAADLDIATPYTIKIPDTFDVKYSQDISFGKIREGAKLFETEKNFENEYFPFRRFAKENGKDEYVIKDLGDKYYFIMKEGKTAIARKTDLVSDSVFGLKAADGRKMYAAVDFGLYGIPVLSKPYILGEDIAKRSAVEITGEVTFNGKKYYVVKQGEKQGFIPVSFLREGFLSDGVYTNVDSGYVYAKGGATVYSDDLETETDVIEKNKKVYLLSVKDGYAEILYDGKTGYVKDSSIVKTSRRNVMKASAVIILAVSLFATSMFFERKYLFKE